MQTFLQGMAQGIALGGVYALIAFALSTVYSVTRLLNFAHGDLLVLAMYLAFALATKAGLDPYLSILVVAPAMFGFGVIVFYLVFARVLTAPILLVIQVTLGLAFVIQSVLLMVFSSDYRTVPSALEGARWFFGPVVLKGPLVVAFIVSIVLACFFNWVLRHTEFGRRVLAVAEDAEAASLSGINVRRVQLLVFSGALGVLGVVGPIVTPVFILEPSLGLHLSLISFIVLILGGTNSFIGTLIAGVIIGVAEAFGALYMNPPEFAAAIPYIIFILFLLIRPSGLLGRA